MSQPSLPPRSIVPRTPAVAVGNSRLEVKNLDQRWYTDAYHYMLAISWLRLLVIFFFVYCGTNALFGFLYWLGGNDIANARPGSFADAFWFSVQTYATIGYGGMSPATTYAHLLVTLEAFIGMMAMALGTGIVFAKFSRPKARIAFSEKIVVHVRNGKPVLEFRLANQRRSSLSDAAMKFSVVKDEMTAEGQPMRRGYALELERSHTPVLSLAWNLIHVLDERSPVWGINLGQLEQVRGFIASLTAHDDTLSETVHARRFYNPEDLLLDTRFVDMIDSKSQPGVISIDHSLLNEVRPVPAGSVASDADSEATSADPAPRG